MSPYDLQGSSVLDQDGAISIKDITSHCQLYKGTDVKRSVAQLVTTLALFAAACTLIYMLQVQGAALWLQALLVLPAAGLLTRLFIIQHDCGHRSFFKSKKANDWTGRFLSLLTVTPYDFWRRAHNMHHATSGNLDRRSIGGIDTITVSEYKALSKGQKRAYRLYRNPFLLIILGTPIYTIIAQRFPFNQGTNFYENYKTLSARSIRKSILLTDLCLFVFYTAIGLLLGFHAVFAVYLPILIVTTWIGGWLFYVQHQFEETYWEKHEDWDMQEAALMGSSYYELPKVLQWFTGNIGLHHIHHLCSQIPNYKLQACMDARPELRHINRLTLRDSLKCLHLQLWDEEKRQMIPLSTIDA